MYSIPEWGQSISKAGTLEVLKAGKIIEVIQIPAGSISFSFGRLIENDVTFDHESVSRHHAILQFGPRNSAYIFDLGSTHGSFMNKKQLPQCQFIKVTSGNDILQFGGSSRLFVLNLAEEDSHENSSSEKTSVSGINRFFNDNNISYSDFVKSTNGNLFTCSLNFAEFLSIDSSENSMITSSGSSKEEAYQNFLEDSFNFLSRIGILNKTERYNDEERESTESNFFTTLTDKTQSNLPLTEDQVALILNKSKSESTFKKNEIASLQDKLEKLNNEEADDFDIYVADIKKAEIVEDIGKRQKEMEILLKEQSKLENILKIIGYKKPVSSETDTDSKRLNVRTSTESLNSSKKIKLVSSNNFISSNTEDEIQEDSSNFLFEDATINDEGLDLDTIKRKYKY